ncbi:hypothetical protein GCM10025792_06110 [Pseudonocardia tropica]
MRSAGTLQSNSGWVCGALTIREDTTAPRAAAGRLTSAAAAGRPDDRSPVGGTGVRDRGRGGR